MNITTKDHLKTEQYKKNNTERAKQRFLLFLFLFLFYSYAHTMFGSFLSPSPTPPLPPHPLPYLPAPSLCPHPLATQAETILPLSLILLKRECKQ
jgi:hypothetical protein